MEYPLLLYQRCLKFLRLRGVKFDWKSPPIRISERRGEGRRWILRKKFKTDNKFPEMLLQRNFFTVLTIFMPIGLTLLSIIGRTYISASWAWVNPIIQKLVDVLFPRSFEEIRTYSVTFWRNSCFSTIFLMKFIAFICEPLTKITFLCDLSMKFERLMRYFDKIRDCNTSSPRVQTHIFAAIFWRNWYFYETLWLNYCFFMWTFY